MQAVILAGGKGTRLAERLLGRPKPLVLVGGVPLLERQILALAEQGVDDVVVLVNHAADQIEAFFRSRQLGVSVRLVDDGEPRGTAGALLAVYPLLADQFLVVYGDTLFDIDLAHMLAHHQASNADVTLLLHPNDHPSDSDIVELDRNQRVTRFHGYPHMPGHDLRNLVNAAFYIVEKRALTSWREFAVPADLAKDLFPAMLAAGTYLNGYISFEYIKDLGTPQRLDKVEEHLASGMIARASRRNPQRAVFLDRDGTLNILNGYIRTVDDMILLPNAAESVRRLNNAEYRVIVVTNQPVVARGECSLEMLRHIHNRMEVRLGERGAYIDALYLCPHHPHSGFAGEASELKIACDCRKPATGMIQAAVRAMNIDVSRSWLVGDSSSDMLAARRAGLRSVLVETGEGGRDGKYSVIPDFVCSDIAAAAELIVVTFPHAEETVREWLPQFTSGDLVIVNGLPAGRRRLVVEALRIGLAARGLDAHAVPMGRLVPSSVAVLKRWFMGDAGALPITDGRLPESGNADIVELRSESVLIAEEASGVCELNGYTRRRSWRVQVDDAQATMVMEPTSSQ